MASDATDGYTDETFQWAMDMRMRMRRTTIAEIRRRGHEVADDSFQDEYGNEWPVITVANFDAILDDMKEATDGK